MDKFSNLRTKRNIPNLITLIRFFLVIIEICLLLIVWSDHTRFVNSSYSNMNYTSWLFICAGIIFFIASFTDFLDGYLARKWNAVSIIGTIFDPVCDKILTTSSLIMFAALNIISPAFPIFFIIRDLFVDCFRIVLAKYNCSVSASWHGKVKTILLFSTIIIIFFIVLIQNNIISYVFDAVLLVTLLWSYVSMIAYFHGGMKQLIKNIHQHLPN